MAALRLESWTGENKKRILTWYILLSFSYSTAVYDRKIQ